MQRRLLLILLLMLPLLAGCNPSKSKPNETKKPLYISAWYATYDSARGLKSFTEHLDIFNEINPVWYNLNPAYFATGEAPLTPNLLNHDTILSVAKYAGIKVLPTIQNFGAANFDRTVIGQIIGEPGLRRKHVQEIVDLVKIENYDGIDIDYENLVCEDRQAFSAFIAELGQALHQAQKQLSVTVYAKTSDAAIWAGPGAQDWASLALNADSLKIMVYDYHWAAFHAGPISPVDWLEAILKHAATIPEARGKIMVGLPFYGLDWGEGSVAKEKAYQDAMNLLVQYSDSSLTRNDVDHSADSICGAYSKNVELHFQYQTAGILHTVYFQDSEALRRRLEIIHQYPLLIKGVTFWRLGGEDPRSWEELRNARN
jgi:spore germination protein